MKRSVASILLLICAAALAGCGLFEKTDKTTNWSAQQLYNEAKSEMDAQNFATAIEYYEKLETRFPFGRFAQQAQLDVAYAYYKQNEYDSAVAACERFIKLYPNHANLDYVYYLKGLVFFAQDVGFLGRFFEQDQSERDPKAMRDAFETFKDLIARFPNSKYAPDAADRMRYLVNTLSQHEVNVARYYLKREAYVAATMRAKYALENYPQTPALEEALFIMVSGYDALGMTDLRNDANSVLVKNFPNSPYLKGDVKGSSEWWKLWK